MNKALVALAVVGLMGCQDGGPTQVTQGSFDSRAPAWSPDGTSIAFESNRSGNWDIDVLHIESGEVTHLISSEAEDRYPTWSPDGQQLAVVRIEDGQSDLHIVEVATGATRRLPNAGAELFPHWAPDGTRIAFSRRAGDSIQLVRIDVRSLVSEPLVRPTGRDVWPRWSPDGSRVVFFSRRHGQGDQDDLYIFDSADEGLRRLTTQPGHDFCPSWSPDGGNLVYVGVEETGDRSLYVISDVGERRATLGRGFYRVTEPAWSPSGRWIAYAARLSETEPYQIFVERVELN